MNLKNINWVRWASKIYPIHTELDLKSVKHFLPMGKILVKTGDLIWFNDNRQLQVLKPSYNINVVSFRSSSARRLERQPVMYMYHFNDHLHNATHIFFFDGRHYYDGHYYYANKS